MSCWSPAQEQLTVREAAVGCQVHTLGTWGELKRAWISHIKERCYKFLAACSERTHLWSYQGADIWYQPYTGCWEPCRLDRARLNVPQLLNPTNPLSCFLSSCYGMKNLLTAHVTFQCKLWFWGCQIIYFQKYTFKEFIFSFIYFKNMELHIEVTWISETYIKM